MRNIHADITSRSYQEGLEQLDSNAPFELLMLDHDLSSYDDTGRERTGYDIVKWLAENQDKLPHRITLVTSNPIGLKDMASMLVNLGYERLNPREFQLTSSEEPNEEPLV